MPASAAPTNPWRWLALLLALLVLLPGAAAEKKPKKEKSTVGDPGTMGDGDFAISDLPRPAFPAQLSYRLDQQQQAVHAGMAVGEPAAIGIDWKCSLRSDPPVLHEGATLTFGTKAEILQE